VIKTASGDHAEERSDATVSLKLDEITNLVLWLATAELIFSESRRRASAARAGRARPAGGLRPASAGAPAGA
jgi:hypothetical protein